MSTACCIIWPVGSCDGIQWRIDSATDLLILRQLSQVCPHVWPACIFTHIWKSEVAESTPQSREGAFSLDWSRRNAVHANAFTTPLHPEGSEAWASKGVGAVCGNSWSIWWLILLMSQLTSSSSRRQTWHTRWAPRSRCPHWCSAWWWPEMLLLAQRQSSSCPRRE